MGDWRPAPPREGCFPRRPPQAGLEETRPGGLLPFSLPEPRPQWTEPARPAWDSWPSAWGGAGGRPRWCPRADAAAEVCQPVRRPSGPPGADGGGTGSCWLHAVMAHASSPSSDCRGGLWGGLSVTPPSCWQLNGAVCPPNPVTRVPAQSPALYPAQTVTPGVPVPRTPCLEQGSRTALYPHACLGGLCCGPLPQGPLWKSHR